MSVALLGMISLLPVAAEDSWEKITAIVDEGFRRAQAVITPSTYATEPQNKDQRDWLESSHQLNGAWIRNDEIILKYNAEESQVTEDPHYYLQYFFFRDDILIFVSHKDRFYTQDDYTVRVFQVIRNAHHKRFYERRLLEYSDWEILSIDRVWRISDCSPEEEDKIKPCPEELRRYTFTDKDTLKLEWEAGDNKWGKFILKRLP